MIAGTLLLYSAIILINTIDLNQGSILNVPATSPSAEVCITGDMGYEWHYSAPMGPLTSSLHVGYGIDVQQYKRGIISPVTPLFTQLHISITSPLSQEPNATKMTSPVRTVNIYPKQRNGIAEYNQVLEELIQEEVSTWNYSKNSTDHDAVYFFLPESSIGTPSFYTHQYIFAGAGVLRYFTFIISQQPDEDRFPSLWPWISAKLQPEKEVSISTHLMISQEVFTLSHSPTTFAGSHNRTDIFNGILQHPSYFESFSVYQVGYISDIKYGEQLLLKLNVTSKAPPAHPYFSSKLLHAVKDLLTEAISVEEFDEKYPQVTYNVSFEWNPISLTTRKGRELVQCTILRNLYSTELLDILESWRDSVLQRDPLLFYPIAMKARLIEFDSENSVDRIQEDIKEFKDEEMKNEIEIEQDENITAEKNEESMSSEGEENSIILKAGKVINIYVSRCAYGSLPPQSVLEMFWELSFLTTITAFSLVTVLSYFCLGGILHQIVRQGQLRLPFFVHIHEVGLRLRLLYIWP